MNAYQAGFGEKHPLPPVTQLIPFDAQPSRLSLVLSVMPENTSHEYQGRAHKTKMAIQKLLATVGECPDDVNFWEWYIKVRCMRVNTVTFDFISMNQHLTRAGYYSHSYKTVARNYKLGRTDGVDKIDTVLTEDEIALLARKTYEVVDGRSRMKQKALDMFLLSCYTAARYNDIPNIVKSEDAQGNPVLIYHNRKGTKSQSVAWNPAVQGALDRGLYKFTVGINAELTAALRVVLFETLPSASNRLITYHHSIPGKGRKLFTNPRIAHITFHTARHTFCTRLLRIGVSPAVVAKLAGHKDISTTMKYYNWMLQTEANDILRGVYAAKGVVSSVPAWGEGASDLRPLPAKIIANQTKKDTPNPAVLSGSGSSYYDDFEKKYCRRHNNPRPLRKKKKAIVDEVKRRGLNTGK